MKPPRKGNRTQGAKLRAIRMGKGYTVTEAAFHAGVSAAHLISLETGARPISDSALVKFSRGWKRKFDWMVEAVRGLDR